MYILGNTKGPAPPAPEDKEDIIGRINKSFKMVVFQLIFIIDECIKFFKANVFFKSYKPDNDADRLLIYITLWIQGTNLSSFWKLFVNKITLECLKVLQKVTSKDQGWKELYSKCVQDFALPGDSRFPLNNYLHKPKNPTETNQMREYLKVNIS